MVDIKGFIKTSLVDWDGKITSVLFLPRCNFRCPMCHNYGLVLHPEKYDDISLEIVDEYLKENKDFLDGVVITGGEPTIYPDILELCRHFKKIGLSVKLDTNGSKPKVLEKLLCEKLVDYIAMDVKAPLEKKKYGESAGIDVNLSKIKQSIGVIMSSDIGYEFRMTVIPSFHTIDDIENVARCLKGARRFVLQQFNSENTLEPALNKIHPYERSRFDEFAAVVGKYIKEVKVRA